MKYAFLSAALLAMTANPSLSAVMVMDDFETDLSGWTGNTTQTNIGLEMMGANQYAAVDNTGNPQSFGAVGTTNEGPDYSGVFANGIWDMSVDLAFFDGPFTEARLRFRYQNSSFNGWYFPLVTAGFATSFSTYGTSFDTSWSDAEATAAGWVQEPTSTSFAGLFDDVYTSEIRLVGTENNELRAGIDNYAIAPSTVPVPAPAALLIGALAGLFGFRRTNMPQA